MGSRSALLISCSEYQDSAFPRLTAPENDVESLGAVLRDPRIGHFENVKVLVNKPAQEVRETVEEFFTTKKRADLALLYFSGHGKTDLNGDLYLATHDTKSNLLESSSIPADYLNKLMDNSKSRRIVLILDCCYSGAFATGRSKGAVGVSVNTKKVFEGTGYGRVVLTASDAVQLAWEGEKIEGIPVCSVFTKFLVQGLSTGAADLSQDGKITVDELYQYVHQQIDKLDSDKPQTPQKWSFRQEGELVIAHNPNLTVSPVLKEIEVSMQSP